MPRSTATEICEFITKLRRSSEKGTYKLTVDHIDPRELQDGAVLARPRRDS